MKNSIDSIGNRNRDLPACSAVSQPTALLRASFNDLQSLGIIGVMGWAGHVACMGEGRYVQGFGGRSDEKRPLGRSWHRRETILKRICKK